MTSLVLYGAKGDIEILIKLADEAYSTMQIAAVDFDAVLVAAPHKVTRSSEVIPITLRGPRCSGSLCAERTPDLLHAMQALSPVRQFHYQ
jgi:hypothetical protein